MKPAPRESSITTHGAVTARKRPVCRQWSGSAPILVALCVLLAGTSGCKVTAPIHGMEDSVHARADVAVTAEQIRIRMRSLVEPLSGVIVESADLIGAGTTNRSVRREALLWKLEGVPALREALFRQNPYVAIMDSWVLTWQMIDYFESGRGREVLGDAAPIAVTTCQYLEAQIEEVTASMMISGDVSDARAFAREWARNHPIRYSIASRESTVKRVTELQLRKSFSTQEVAGSLVVTMDDLTRRLSIYSTQLLDQSRWQAELFGLDMADDYQLEKVMPLTEVAVESATNAVEFLARLEPAVREALIVAKTTPELIGRERATAIQAAQQEISRTMEFAQAERIATLEQITKERETAIQDLRQTISDERALLAADVEQISRKVVDHAILRVAQLSAVILVAVFIGTLVLLIVARRLFAKRGLSEAQ